MRYTIGYVDENPKQVAKYERLLRDKFNVIGYDIPMGITKKKLLEQINNSNIDLLLIDYLMTDSGLVTFNGDEIAREFEKLRPRFPILIFTQHEADAFPEVDNPNIIYEKSEARNLDKFTEVLKKNIDVYKKFVAERKKTVSTLINKSHKKKLNAKEQHTLFDKQIELQMLDKSGSAETPFQLLHPNNIAVLKKTADKAEAYLKSLNKKKSK